MMPITDHSGKVNHSSITCNESRLHDIYNLMDPQTKRTTDLYNKLYGAGVDVPISGNETDAEIAAIIKLHGRNYADVTDEEADQSMELMDLMHGGMMDSLDDARELVKVNAAERTKEGKHIRLNWVLKYENNAVVAKLMKEYDLSQEDAEELFKDTLRFLWIANSHSGFCPTAMLDKGWHTFILFTMDYQKFCHKYFGKFIHHRPTRPEDPPDNGESLKRSIEIVNNHFQGNPPKNWVYHVASNCTVSGGPFCTRQDCETYCKS